MIQPALFRNVQESAFYSIDTFINAAKNGKNIVAYSIDGHYWQDIGHEHDILRAEQDILDGRFSI